MENKSQQIIGKKFENGNMNPEITFAWDGLIPGSLTQRGAPSLMSRDYGSNKNHIHGQKINLRDGSVDVTRPGGGAGAQNKSRSRGENRTLTPPPHRVTSMTTRDRILQSEESHRLHHKPGSTIPTLRAGSERTNRAAKWLIDEQYKVTILCPLCLSLPLSS
jgi:hypothetical protein